MKSPFPGMDPYLEQFWGDVHTTLMVYARNQINESLPDDLQARVEESLSVETDEGFHRTVYPDIRVVEEPSAWSVHIVQAVIGNTKERAHIALCIAHSQIVAHTACA